MNILVNITAVLGCIAIGLFILYFYWPLMIPAAIFLLIGAVSGALR